MARRRRSNRKGRMLRKSLQGMQTSRKRRRNRGPRGATRVTKKLGLLDLPAAVDIRCASPSAARLHSLSCKLYHSCISVVAPPTQGLRGLNVCKFCCDPTMIYYEKSRSSPYLPSAILSAALVHTTCNCCVLLQAFTARLPSGQRVVVEMQTPPFSLRLQGVFRCSVLRRAPLFRQARLHIQLQGSRSGAAVKGKSQHHRSKGREDLNP